MPVTYTVILFCISAIAAIAIVITRNHLKKKDAIVSFKIQSVSPYFKGVDCLHDNNIYNDEKTINIPFDLNQSFRDTIISTTQSQDFASHYTDLFEEVQLVVKELKVFHITPSENIIQFIDDYKNIGNLVTIHNENVINSLLDKHKDFFDHCLTYPLDDQQRRSIISEEDNCLVVSSAGSGKTSSIIGKVKYLTLIKGIDPKRILLISYTNKAAAELTERIKTAGLRGYTFHKLAVDIIGKATGVKPSICDNTDTLIVEIYRNLSKSKAFMKSIVTYFIDYQAYESHDEHRKNEKMEQLSEQKSTKLKAMLPDMDGKPIYVKSKQEQKICFALSSLGVNFRYEEPYEHTVADEMHSQYRPDFSIYFNQRGTVKRIYLEHFGVDEHSLVPEWFAKDKNISYEEANEKYNDGISWKKAAHEKFGTTLLVTSSADFLYSDIKDNLKRQLQDAGVPISEKSDEELYNLVLPKDGKKEKSFIRLVATFITLLKSSGKSIDEIIRQAERKKDERSAFIIRNIFHTVYSHYTSALNSSNQIDFTDAILYATKICQSSHPLEFDYIIVDEFQDISIDRYNFLKVLREGNPPAKLYCVGDDWQSIYRFSGSDMALFNRFSDFFGATDICKIETTYRFGEPLVSLSSNFIQKNRTQIQKNIHPFKSSIKTELEFYSYGKNEYCNIISQLISAIPTDKSIFLLGRYSFDDYYLSFLFKSSKEGNKFYYIINGRKIEFLTVHKSKGLEADYVILLQCNKDTYGFPSLMSDDPVLDYVLTQSDQFPFGEERRLFYVAITRAKIKTLVLYNKHHPSVFVNEFLHPETITSESYIKHPNANKKWTKGEEKFLMTLYCEGKSIKQIAEKMGRSQTSIVMRLNKIKKS